MYIIVSSSSQLGTLGAGNHYAEIQVVDEIYNAHAAAKMGVEEKGQVCVMIHSGSRGLGHQVATGEHNPPPPPPPPPSSLPPPSFSCLKLPFLLLFLLVLRCTSGDGTGYEA